MFMLWSSFAQAIQASGQQEVCQSLQDKRTRQHLNNASCQMNGEASRGFATKWIHGRCCTQGMDLQLQVAVNCQWPKGFFIVQIATSSNTTMRTSCLFACPHQFTRKTTLHWNMQLTMHRAACTSERISQVGSEEIQAHSIILGARSPVFERMFSCHRLRSSKGVFASGCLLDCLAYHFRCYHQDLIHSRVMINWVE